MLGLWTKDVILHEQQYRRQSTDPAHGFTVPASRLRDFGNYWIFKQEEFDEM